MLDGSSKMIIFELELNGEHRTSFDLGDADFFDVFASPFFNSMPVMRTGSYSPVKPGIR